MNGASGYPDLPWTTVTSSALIAGLLFGLSLIVVVGPQNAFVLAQGARRSHVGTIVLICAVSDVVLIAAGVDGIGATVLGDGAALNLLRVAGAALLGGYAVAAARRAARAPAVRGGLSGAADTRRAAILACVALTWLNPAVYLDTVVLLGSVADAHPASRWSFGTGAAVGSVLWFLALGYGAGLLSKPLARPGAARALNGFVAAVMAATAIRLLLS
jgi:L-lysine exporter family protein LysE/ArgO